MADDHFSLYLDQKVLDHPANNFIILNLSYFLHDLAKVSCIQISFNYIIYYNFLKNSKYHKSQRSARQYYQFSVIKAQYPFIH